MAIMTDTDVVLLCREQAAKIESDTKVIAALREQVEALTKEPMTKEQASRVRPDLLECRWAHFTDKGPKPWEGYTFMGSQNYGNPYHDGMACLLWVRMKKVNEQNVGESK
jgi:hypothetical protein